MERNLLGRLRCASSYRFYVISLIMVFAFLVRFLLVDTRPFQSDESLYAYAAYAITRGVIPYREIMLAHPPIMYLIFGAFLRFTGTNLQLFRILNYGVFALNILLTYLLCHTFNSSEEGAKTGLLSAALYAFYPTIVGLSLTASAEFILTFFTLCAVLVYTKSVQSANKNFLFLSGIFLGLALMTKFTALFFIVTLALFYAVKIIFAKKSRVDVSDVILPLAGVAIPVVLVLLVVAQHWDVFHVFYLNTYYVQTTRSPFTLAEKLSVLSFYVGTFSFLLMTGALGALHLALDAVRQKNWSRLMPLWIYGANALILAFLPICLPHYFLYLTPYLVLLSAESLGKINDFQVRKPHAKLAEWLEEKGVVVAAFAILLGVATLLALPYAAAQVEYFHESLYTEVEMQIGQYIASRTEFNESIWTSEPAIAFFAERLIIAPRSSEWAFQGFFNDVFNTTYNGDHQGLGVVSPTDFVEAWEKEKIQAIIFIKGTGWVPYPDEILWNGFDNQEGVATYIKEHYEMIKLIKIAEIPYTYEIWNRK